MYLSSLKIIKIYNTISWNTTIEKNKILVNPNRKISRSKMVGINQIKIR